MNPGLCGPGVGQYDESAEGRKKPQWACHFYKFDPIRYEECRHYKLGRVQDVKQHLFRKHNEEVKDMLEKGENKDSRSKTDEDRWNNLWRIIQPGQPLPESPYLIGGGFAEVAGRFVDEYLEQRQGGYMEEQKVLAQFLLFVKAKSGGRTSGSLSDYSIMGVSELQIQNTMVQGYTHLDLTLSTNTFPPSMEDSFPPHNSQPATAVYHGDQALGFMTGPQAPSSFAANTQEWDPIPSAATYHPTPVNQPCWYQQSSTRGVSGYVPYTTTSSNPTGDMHWKGWACLIIVILTQVVAVVVAVMMSLGLSLSTPMTDTHSSCRVAAEMSLQFPD
ncbi:hypothetical protein B0H67DRAFT_485536 [Lasiosphaeris hirsuta]|uniref:Uncharacterized protein n=1 Tax=Lasiosphaeris hirsuta TaxID=260670 RepID=A0AA40ASE2_9PEZI|nr:hypothetical protein B0H67DRAFT_485536 [Lasiosphaeris hirsuta]